MKSAGNQKKNRSNNRSRKSRKFGKIQPNEMERTGIIQGSKISITVQNFCENPKINHGSRKNEKKATLNDTRATEDKDIPYKILRQMRKKLKNQILELSSESLVPNRLELIKKKKSREKMDPDFTKTKSTKNGLEEETGKRETMEKKSRKTIGPVSFENIKNRNSIRSCQ